MTIRKSWLGLLVLFVISVALGIFEWTSSSYQNVVIAGNALVSHRLVNLFCAGALLAMSAQLLQAMYRTPLADPWTVGLMPACALFAMLLWPSGWGQRSMAFTAFAGAALALLFWRLVQYRRPSLVPSRMLLFGFALTALCFMVMGMLLYLPAWSGVDIPFWMLGDATQLPVALWSIPVTLLAFAACLVMAPSLDLLARGEHQAMVLGVEVKRLKRSCYVALMLMIGASFLLVGAMGFVGMLALLLVRPVTGSANRRMLPWSALVGGGLMTLIDWLTHVPFAATMPSGLLAAAIGLLVILWRLPADPVRER